MEVYEGAGGELEGHQVQPSMESSSKKTYVAVKGSGLAPLRGEEPQALEGLGTVWLYGPLH